MTRWSRWNIVRVAVTTAYLVLGWLLFTWDLSTGSLALGLIHSTIVALVTFPVFVESDEAARRSHLPRVELLGVFVLVLVFNMYVASFKVLWQILRGRINPGVVHFRTRLRTDIARVALTSSITLTPGTITLYLDDDHLIVHWLDARTTHSKYASKLVAAPYERLLRRIWA
ncbi:MAG: Na+/H+ antiporter subunit E [Spirochaetota bacterium]